MNQKVQVERMQKALSLRDEIKIVNSIVNLGRLSEPSTEPAEPPKKTPLEGIGRFGK